MNDTPVNHLNRIRLSKAKELMKNKELSLNDVALKAGFKTQSNFTEVFKRIVGMKPTEYRKKYL
jgi:AraC-like DNA-binding protein